MTACLERGYVDGPTLVHGWSAPAPERDTPELGSLVGVCRPTLALGLAPSASRGSGSSGSNPKPLLEHLS